MHFIKSFFKTILIVVPFVLILSAIFVGTFLFVLVSKDSPKASDDNLNRIVSNDGVFDSYYSYDVISKSNSPEMFFGERERLYLKLKNTGNTIWFSESDNSFYLGTSRPYNRDSVFYNELNLGWASGNRVEMSDSVVYPGQTVDFIFEITAPNVSGIYREYFTPLVEYKDWLDLDEIYWDIGVRDSDNPDEELSTTVSGVPRKYIKLKLEEQMMYVYENNKLKYKFVTSTGKPGMDTPKGEFKIYNQYPVSYSAPYELYMDNWMAITADGLYGIHSLPYWKMRVGGRLYEGEDHLGTKVSHGCIRVSLENSKILYDWAEIGTPVFIEN